MNIIKKILTVIGAVVVIAALCALPTMLLWNAIMPLIFGLIKISFIQALWLNLLCGILFKSSSSKED